LVPEVSARTLGSSGCCWISVLDVAMSLLPPIGQREVILFVTLFSLPAYLAGNSA
jgi:hypothetical protein